MAGGHNKGMPQWSDADYLAKLMSNVVKNERGCWVMTAGYEHKFRVDNGTPGYRGASYRGIGITAHRLSWFLHYGKIPRGKIVMHKCDNPPCINPDHLKLGTRAQNNKDMKAKGRYNNQKLTHCVHGHAFDEANTRVYRDKHGWIARQCRQCSRDRYRRDRDRVQPPTSETL